MPFRRRRPSAGPGELGRVPDVEVSNVRFAVAVEVARAPVGAGGELVGVPDVEVDHVGPATEVGIARVEVKVDRYGQRRVRVGEAVEGRARADVAAETGDRGELARDAPGVNDGIGSGLKWGGAVDDEFQRAPRLNGYFATSIEPACGTSADPDL